MTPVNLFWPGPANWPKRRERPRVMVLEAHDRHGRLVWRGWELPGGALVPPGDLMRLDLVWTRR